MTEMFTSDAPDAIEPSPPIASPRSGSPLLAVVIVALTLLMPVILLGALFIVSRAGGADVFDVIDGREQLDSIPDFDMEMEVEVVLESGPTVVLPEDLHPGEDRDVQQDSVQLIATVSSPDGSTDLYGYEAVLLDSATQQTLHCLGLAHRFSATVSCRNSDETDPVVFWGTDDRSSGTWYSVGVSGLPLDSTKLVTETASGLYVGSNIVNGMAYQEWPAGEGSPGGLLPNGGREFGQAKRTIALDGQGTVLWSEVGKH